VATGRQESVVDKEGRRIIGLCQMLEMFAESLINRFQHVMPLQTVTDTAVFCMHNCECKRRNVTE